MTPQLLGNVKKPTGIDISHLTIEDDLPVDNLQSAQQQRLLVEPVYSSSALAVPFLVEANVGVFYELHEDPIVPDVFLSLGVQHPEDYTPRENRSYFVWEFGKLPEVCIEIVSNKEGDEINLSRKSQRKGKTLSKKDRYGQIGIRYYIVFDPLKRLQDEMNGSQVQIFGRLLPGQQSELQLLQSLTIAGDSVWLSDIGIGLTLWEGTFEGNVSRLWLRWCDRDGIVIPTGAERAENERCRAENERRRAENERYRAENAESRAENAESRAQRLADRLRELGLNPEDL
jgi:Uma2 family endonuclease